MKAIEVRGLAKSFGSLMAVDHIDFDVEQGEMFGLLGPNGAGKTTTIRMLTTLLHPSEGEARVWGYDVRDEAARVREVIGVVFQEPALDLDLTGEENMRFHGRLYGLSEGEIRERTKELLELVGLTDWGDKLVRTYSGGMRRRLEVARALVHRPKVLFLDEPTLGLDPQGRRKIWEYIRRVREEWGVTVVLTTHYMEEADQLCERVAVIDRGKLVAVDTPDALKAMVGGEVLQLKLAGMPASAGMPFGGMAGPGREGVAGPAGMKGPGGMMGAGGMTGMAMRVPPAWSPAGRLIKELKSRGIAGEVRVEGGYLHVSSSPELKGGRLVSKVFEVAGRIGVEIEEVRLRRPTLEDAFLHLTGRRLSEGEGVPGRRMEMRRKGMMAGPRGGPGRP